MEQKEKTPQAFPTTRSYKTGHGDIMHETIPGMTLRDYFAAKAMQGNFASCNPGFIDTSPEMLKMLAESYYAIADAMLAERSKA